ncbi:MAG: cysteine synthase A [Muribaculaceae bacterium]|nr:cysteine synthase A [Muribaculaceae bacterium]
MGRIYKNLIELIGHTPLLEVSAIEKAEGLKARVLAKLEYFNPGGSVKDRIAFAMVDDAEKKGILQQGGTIIEPTSGNTGVGLAWVGTVKGYKVVLTMPETMSVERQNLLRALGAKLILTPGSEGMKGAIAIAQKLQSETPNSVILGQFDNPANPKIHFETTAAEIWEDTDGKVDIYVAGVGTGGTLTGTGAGLKARKPGVKVVAVEPKTSAVLNGEKPGPHKIQGIGAGFIPGNYNAQVVDEVMDITDDEAISASRKLARKEGLLVGISSGAAMAAALKEARKEENAGKTIVCVLPDTGERYLSTILYAFDEYPLPE